MKLILKWLILSAAVYAAAEFVPGVSIFPWYTALIVGACLAFINMIIKPIINILTLPITIVTLGLFSLVVNAVLFWFLSTLVKGFGVETFMAAFLGALLVSIVSWLLGKIVRTDD